VPVDLRTRRDADVQPVVARQCFEQDLPEAFELNGKLLALGLERLKLRPFTLRTGDGDWTLVPYKDHVLVRAGGDADAACVVLDDDQLSDLINDQATPMTFMTAGTLEMPAGRLGDFLDWWTVLRAALDGRPLHSDGAVRLLDRNGNPLDLARGFAPDDSLEEMSHFLHEAGFLHLTGVFTQDEMNEISNDMDAAAGDYRDGDGRSWWATVAGGERRLVRMQGFDEKSRITSELLSDARFLRLAEITGDGHRHMGLEGNRIEALVKPIGVVEGISDLPWHKDCSLGRHSYECCSLTAGISVTGATKRSGQLRVVAGSHRALIWPALASAEQHGLPEVDLPTATGDVTLHLSCTMHMSQAPKERERRVMYTSFRLPGFVSDDRSPGRARIRRVREGAYTTVSQIPSDTD